MVHLANTGSGSGSEYFARWVAACVAEPPPAKSSIGTVILVCLVVAVVIVAIVAGVIVKRRRARGGGGDGLGGLDQPILDDAIDDKSDMRTSW